MQLNLWNEWELEKFMAVAKVRFIVTAKTDTGELKKSVPMSRERALQLSEYWAMRGYKNVKMEQSND